MLVNERHRRGAMRFPDQRAADRLVVEWQAIMAGYVALVHKEDGTSYAVSFRGVPGCISAGDTAIAMLARPSPRISR
jgi:hypothetical protein